jgi:phosphoenolpyruvate carboxylase
MAVREKNQISSSVRALYRIIGRIIGKQIFDRITNDDHISSSDELRRSIAQEVISSITEFRKELGSDRDLKKIDEIISKLFDKENKDISIKQLAWILEAYLLLNQSSTASAEVTRPSAGMPDSLLMSKLIENIRTRILREEKLAKVFTKDFSLNLVLTAHPTAGIQPDYIHHIKNLVESIQKISYQIDPKDWEKVSHDHTNENLESNIAEIIEDINLSISHMVRAQPYNTEKLYPSDESSNFLSNISAAWSVIPSKVISLEKELRKYLGKDFRIHSRFFRVHSWVARDIDGNPTVSAQEHIKSIYNEKLFFLSQYRKDLEELWQNLSDDFTNDPKLPTKTFFVDDDFKNYYQQISDELGDSINYHNKAYRVVIFKIISELDDILNKHLFIGEVNPENLKAIESYDLNEIIVKPLELIRANKESILIQEIDVLIRKVQIFGSFGSHGHTRQGASTLALMAKYLCALWDNQVEAKTNFLLREEKFRIQYPVLKNKITLQYKKDSEKVQKKLIQTFDLLELSELGSIKRQIISMNESFEDMLNALCVAKSFGAFKPSTPDSLPWSRLEIVPLTEQIIDLRNSYQVTIDALTNRAWHEYLIANQGRFYKMRGPSDSGKQNGFIASQWEMFRSKQFDTIVVEIFNAFLLNKLEGDDSELKVWQDLELDEVCEELKIIEDAFTAFVEFFSSTNFDLELWKKAYKELDLKKVRLINFDGWGEPVERGGGLEFENTVKYTQPNGSLPYYERTLQGGGAQQLNSELRTKQAIQDFTNGVTEIAVRRFALNKSYDPKAMVLDPNYVHTMKSLVRILRSALRGEVFGLDLEDDTKVENEDALRNYFRHVIKSPLVFLDLFNIASRPTSRSGSQIKEYLNQDEYANDIDLMIEKLPKEDIIAILGDVRAIPYAAMFSLLGGNHVSFYGYEKILESKEKYSFTKGQKKKTLIEWIQYFYNTEVDTQESLLTRHMIDSLERGIFTADQACYRQAHEMIELSTNSDYRSGDDRLLLSFIQAEQETINFVAAVKGYKVDNPKKVDLRELMQHNPQERDLLLARRDDAAIPRIGLARAIAEIFKYTKAKDINPLEETNIPLNLTDLLRKAFAAGASTFGNGCID